MFSNWFLNLLQSHLSAIEIVSSQLLVHACLSASPRVDTAGDHRTHSSFYERSLSSYLPIMSLRMANTRTHTHTGHLPLRARARVWVH